MRDVTYGSPFHRDVRSGLFGKITHHPLLLTCRERWASFGRPSSERTLSVGIGGAEQGGFLYHH